MNAPAPSSARSGASSRRWRILWAEDNLQLGDILVCLLTRLGHEVRHARDGGEAWALLARDLGAFDLVVTDHQMPELGGPELVRRLRAARFAGRIVVYSSALEAGERREYERLGVDRIVEKAAAPAHLLAAIAAL